MSLGDLGHRCLPSSGLLLGSINSVPTAADQRPTSQPPSVRHGPACSTSDNVMFGGMNPRIFWGSRARGRSSK